jgi:hypothetical protein
MGMLFMRKDENAEKLGKMTKEVQPHLLRE